MKKRLIELILERTFRFTEEPSFKLASGKMSNFYFNCKPTTLNSEGKFLIGNLLYGIIKSESRWRVKGVGGLTLGADPVANAIAYTAYIKGDALESFVVRKEPKKHGTMQWIEGEVKKGDRVLIIEDVITTGSSVIETIDLLNEHGLKVSDVVVYVDREEGGKENLEAKGCRVHSVTTLSQLIKAK